MVEVNMKACILSMQRVNNMGSLLQSYALKKILENMGSCVEFIDIKRIDEDYILLGEYKQKFHGENEPVGLKGKLSKIDRYIWNRILIKMKLNIQNIEFERFRSNVLEIQKTSSSYDLCVIGSDEVFNCLSAGTWGFTSQLFGNVDEAKKVITYAASCGSTTYEELPTSVANRIIETFKNVDSFSVRDKNTHEFVMKLTDRKISDNLDPVLIYDFEKEIGDAVLPKLPEHSCIVYSYYNRFQCLEEIKEILDFCEKNNLTPVALGAPQFWIKNYVVCSPFQCLKVFQNADFVITDTFHGTIFSAKYANKFAVITRESNYNKLSDLIKRLGIERHLVDDLSQLKSVYSLEKEYESIKKVIETERSNTYKYLERYIDGE